MLLLSDNELNWLKTAVKRCILYSEIAALRIIKLACESQLTEILFKLLIIKLACESQLTEILFKLIIIIIIILLRLNFWLLLLLEL